MAEPTLQAAINNVVPNVNANASKANFELWLQIFGNAVAAPFNKSSLDQRSVENWLVPSLDIRDQLPVGVLSNQETQLIIEIVFRTLEATLAAQTAGRISAAQGQMVLDQYNLAWP